MKPTIKQLQAMIEARDDLLKDYKLWVKLLGKAVQLSKEREGKLRARIKVLNKALVASEKDYQALKRNK